MLRKCCMLFVLSGVASAQSYNDVDVLVNGLGQHGRALDVARAEDGTVVAAYVDHVWPPDDHLVVKTSADGGRTWTEIYRDPLYNYFIKDLSLEVASGFTRNPTADKRFYVAMHRVYDRRGVYEESIWLLGGAYDRPSFAPGAHYRTCAVDIGGALPPPARHGADLHLSTAVFPTGSDQYSVGVAYMYPDRSDNVDISYSHDYAASFEGPSWGGPPRVVAGPGALGNGSWMCAHPSLTCDPVQNTVVIAFEDTTNHVVRVAEAGIQDHVVQKRPLQLTFTTDANDRRPESKPAISAQFGKRLLACLAGSPGQCGEYAMVWYTMTPVQGWRQKTQVIHSMTMSAPDAALKEGNVFVTAMCAKDSTRGKCYPVVMGFQGGLSDTVLHAEQVSDDYVYSTSPKVAVARSIDWFAAVYGFCWLDVWNGTDAYGVMVDPGH